MERPISPPDFPALSCSVSVQFKGGAGDGFSFAYGDKF